MSSQWTLSINNKSLDAIHMFQKSQILTSLMDQLINFKTEKMLRKTKVTKEFFFPQWKTFLLLLLSVFACPKRAHHLGVKHVHPHACSSTTRRISIFLFLYLCQPCVT